MTKVKNLHLLDYYFSVVPEARDCVLLTKSCHNVWWLMKLLNDEGKEQIEPQAT